MTTARTSIWRAKSSRDDLEIVFVPGDPPRTGRFAVWGGDVAGAERLEMFHDVAGRASRRATAVRYLAIEEALPMLLACGEHGRSVAAWSAAVVAGLEVVARGAILPAVTSSGYAAWRVGPLEAADAMRLHALAAAMPPQGHATVMRGAWPAVRVADPATLIRDFWDALADTLTRSPEDQGAFAGEAPVTLSPPLDWLRPGDASRVVLRVSLPAVENADSLEDAAGDARCTLSVWLRSAADPSLLIEAAELLSAPLTVAARFGVRPQEALLISLRQGARIWPPLIGVLEGASPRRIEVDDTDMFGLLELADQLERACIELLVPSELLGEPIAFARVAVPTPERVTDPVLGLPELLRFSYRPGDCEEPLTEAELEQLAQAKRPLVRLRGRWVRVDADVLRRLRRKRGPLLGMAALGAALCGSVDIDGERVEFEATGGLLTLRDTLARLPEVPVPTALHATLRPYQARGLNWLAGMAHLGLGGCLADDMGLGKTIQVIALHLHREKQGPTLVVCPTSLLGNWEREIARFAPGVPVRRYHGGDRHLDGVAQNEIVLVTYGLIRSGATELSTIDWDLVVADEAQNVKNPFSETARQLRLLPARARFALTGTPVENRLSDVWALLDWTTPGLLGSLDHFTRTVAVAVERDRDPEAIARFSRLIRPFVLRRCKSDPLIAPELPAKTETDRLVPLTAEQATLYQAVVTESLARIRESAGMSRRGLVFKLLTGLKQICDHPALYLRESAPIHGRSGKLATLDDLLEVILAEGESVLVFSQYVRMCALIDKHLAERGIGTLFLHGQTANRDRMVAEFQSGAAPVFLLSLRAGGVGLNLTRATHVVHFDRWWNPAVEDQATDRAYRIGQDRPVQVHKLVTEGTIEDRIATMLAGKRALVDSVIGAGEHWLTELTTDELAGLVSLEAT